MMVDTHQKKSLNIGIIRFPCSNCDFDALNYFRKFGHRAEFIWYRETKSKQYDLIVIPGGFAFGDRVYKKATGKYIMDPGAQALSSPVMDVIHNAAKNKVPILGICNGFQILVKAGLLPGSLKRNKSKKFFCDWTECEIIGNSFFGEQTLKGKILKIPVAHGYGRYVVNKKESMKLRENGQVFLKYKNFNPNGSIDNIAGVCNEDGNIFGLMPHPERSPDGKFFMKAIEKFIYE